MTAGYSGTPLAKKLGIKEGHRVAVLGDPGHLGSLLGDLPAGVRVVADPPLPRKPRAGSDGAFDVVIAFALEQSLMERRFRHGHRLLEWNGGLWMSWPKMKSPSFSTCEKGRFGSMASIRDWWTTKYAPWTKTGRGCDSSIEWPIAPERHSNIRGAVAIQEFDMTDSRSNRRPWEPSRSWRA